MKTHLKNFLSFLKEENTVPQNEERDYYLAPALEILHSHPKISEEIFDGTTAIMAVVEQQVKNNNHTIRQNYLDIMAMELSMITPSKILNYQNIDGDSVIHITTKMNCYPTSNLDMFKENGANFSLINRLGETPLIKISEKSSLDDLKFIHGYSDNSLLNHRDLIGGSTALMRAVLARRILNINFLLESGASLYISNNSGANIIQLIKSEDYKMKSERSYYRTLENMIEKYK